MPNWCHNLLKVKGDQAIIDAFDQAVRTEKTALSLHALRPRPTFEAEDDSWWEWSITHWGTKRDVEAESMKTNEGMSYGFDSAWSPPLAWVLFASFVYPELHFELIYFEPNMFFGGIVELQNEEVIKDDQRQFNDGDVLQIAVDYFGYERSAFEEEEHESTTT